MLGGRVLRVTVRVLPLALVLGLFGASQSDSAGALGPTLPTIPTPTLPTIGGTATLVSVTVTPPVANVAVGATEQFSATGLYSDLSTRDLTDSVTWSSSSSSTATISNTPGSQGLATGVADGAATITATDPTRRSRARLHSR